MSIVLYIAVLLENYTSRNYNDEPPEFVMVMPVLSVREHNYTNTDAWKDIPLTVIIRCSREA